MTTLNINLSTEQFIMMFQQFSKREQKKIVEKIQTLDSNSFKEINRKLQNKDDYEIPVLMQESQSFAFLNDEIEDIYSDKNLKVRY